MLLRTTSAALTLLASVLCTTTAATTTCSTMSLNVRTSNAGDSGPASWDARKPHMKRLLEQRSPDFVGTQEASPAQYEYLRSVPGYAAIGACAGSCESNERTFILYKSSDWTLLANGDFALSDNTELLGSNTWGLVYNRMATWGRFRHTRTGATACVFNTHYDMAIGHVQSSKLIAAKMATLCAESDIAMLTGDFNTDMGSEAMQYLIGSTGANAAAGAGAGGSASAVSAFPLVNALDRVGATGGTFIGNGVFQGALSSTRLDFVFARAANLCVQHGEVVDERFDGSNAISDHAQVVATFCLGDGCTGCAGADAGVSANTLMQDAPESTPTPTPTPTPTMVANTPIVTPAATTPATLTTVNSNGNAVVAGATPRASPSKRPDCDAQ